MAPGILILGVGNVGAVLASTLLKSGRDNKISLWNRSDKPQVKALVESGAHFEADVAAAITGSDIIILSLLDYPSVFATLRPVSSTLAGKVIITITNGTPREAVEAQALARESGAAQYFEGALMATPDLVGGPYSSLIYSGETEETFKSVVSDIVSPLGAAVYVGEDIASANTNDLAALAGMYGMFSGAFIGIGLLKKQLAKSGGEGKVSTAVNGVVIPLLKALVPYVGLIAKAVDEEDWDNNLGNPLGMQLAGVQNILQASKEEGVDAAGLESLRAMMQKAVDGRGTNGGVAEVARFII